MTVFFIDNESGCPYLVEFKDAMDIVELENWFVENDYDVQSYTINEPLQVVDEHNKLIRTVC